MGFLGSLVRAGVTAVGGGLRGQNEGDDENYRRQEQAKRDRIVEEHYQTEQLLKQYAEDRQRDRDRSEADWHAKEGKHYDDMDRPEWERQGYPDFQSWEKDHKKIEPVDHTDRRPTWQKEGYPSFNEWQDDQSGHIKRMNPAGEQISDLNTSIDDSDREVARAERKLPKPWEQQSDAFKALHDSTAYSDTYSRAAAAVDSLRSRRDRFTQKRDSIVGARHGLGPQDFGDVESGSGDSTGGPPATGPAAQLPITPASSAPPAAPAAGAKVSAAMEEINRQYQDKLKWRGPNGERKDPEKLRQRYLEAMAQVAGGSRQ